MPQGPSAWPWCAYALQSCQLTVSHCTEALQGGRRALPGLWVGTRWYLLQGRWHPPAPLSPPGKVGACTSGEAASLY